MRRKEQVACLDKRELFEQRRSKQSTAAGQDERSRSTSARVIVLVERMSSGPSFPIRRIAASGYRAESSPRISSHEDSEG